MTTTKESVALKEEAAALDKKPAGLTADDRDKALFQDAFAQTGETL